MREVRSWTLSTLDELTGLRAAVRDDPLVRPLPAETSDAVLLVTTELATNALRHGAPPAVVRVALLDELLLVDVADQDPGSRPVVAGTRAPGAGGFGLRLAYRLATDVGWYRIGGSKHVWATFARS